MKKLFLFFILYTLLYTNCFSQWSRTNGPYGGWCRSISSANGVLYVGSGGAGAFRSFDNGITWSNIFDLTTVWYCDIAGVIAFDSYIFIATSSNGIFRSSDNGNSWQPANIGMTSPNSLNDITISGQYLICGIYRAYRSSNYGASWDSCTSGMTTPIYIHSYSSFGANLYAATNHGLYLSTNNGTYWVSINNGINESTVESIGTDGINLYAGTSNGIYKSTNNGSLWVQINNGIPLGWVYGIGYNGIYVFATIYQSLYRTSNSGVNWEACNGPLSVSDHNFLLSNNRFFCISGGGPGIQYTTDNGNTWVNSNNGFYNFYSSSIAVKDNLIYTCGAQQGLAVTSDEGVTWLSISNNLIDSYTVDIASNSSCIFLSSGTKGMIKSSNNGINWIQCNSGIIDSNSSKTIFAFDDEVFISSGNAYLYKTTNSGINWIPLPVASYQIKTLARIGNVILGGNDFMEGGGMVRSTNNGLNWTSVQGPFLPRSIIAKDSVFYLVNAPVDFYKSTNLGLNWTLFSTDFTGYFNKLYVIENKFVILNDNGIFTSSNNGVNWIARNQGLPANIRSASLAVKGNYIYLGSEHRGVWKRIKSDFLKVDKVSYVIPSEFTLFQNYPNPFNPTTKIRYNIPMRSPTRAFGDDKVVMKVFDILGKEIATLVNEKQSPGTYEVTFDGSSLTSGVYYYRLTSGDYVETKKMVMIK